MAIVEFADTRERLRVGKILCLGRNYSAHAKEMHAEIPEQPVVFLKPSTALIGTGEDVVIPAISHDMHHEVEMVLVIGKKGKNIPASSALEYIAGYAVGLDMTLRDVQAEAKKKGLPWSVSKGFDTSAPLSSAIRREGVRDPHDLMLTLTVNGEVRQKSCTRNMLFRVEEIVSYVSSLFTLEPGDLIYTGTPEGVGKVVPGDVLEATLESVGSVRVGVK